MKIQFDNFLRYKSFAFFFSLLKPLHLEVHIFAFFSFLCLLLAISDGIIIIIKTYVTKRLHSNFFGKLQKLSKQVFTITCLM